MTVSTARRTRTPRDFQLLVKEFNQKIAQSTADAEFRIKLIVEEVKETIEAIEDKDLVETIDGLCDVLYVTYGAADVFELVLDTRVSEEPDLAKEIDWGEMKASIPAFIEQTDLVCKALRLGDLDLIETELLELAAGCWDASSEGLGVDLRPFFREVHRTNMHKLNGPRREDGKQLKPPDWQPPRIEAMYNRLVAGNPPACSYFGHEVKRLTHPGGGYFCETCGGLLVDWIQDP